MLTNIDEKGKTNVLVSRTRKRKYNDIEGDVRKEMAKKFEREKEVYQVEIDCLKLKWRISISSSWRMMKYTVN